MAFDSILGMGRLPKSGIVNGTTTVSGAMSIAGGGGAQTITISSTISNTPVRAYALQVNVISANSNATTGAATQVILKIFTNNELIAQYSLPDASADSIGQLVADVIPITREFWTQNDTISAVLTNATVGGNGYQVKVSVSLLAVQI